LASTRGGNAVDRVILRRARKLLCAETRAVDDRIKAQAFAVLPTEERHPSIFRRHQAIDACVERDHATAVLKIPTQRQHEAMAVDHARFS